MSVFVGSGYFFFLMIRRPPRSTRTDTLSLHDALPISVRLTLRPLGGVEHFISPKGSIQLTGFGAYWRSEEHTSALQSLMRISYAVFCLKKQKISASFC